jgi:hypothetical protein
MNDFLYCQEFTFAITHCLNGSGGQPGLMKKKVGLDVGIQDDLAGPVGE